MLNPVVVFQQIVQAGQAGRVDFESGPTKHQFYLSEGQLIYASSSDPYYSLDAYLLRKQSLSKLDQKYIRSRAQEELKPIEAIVEAQGLMPRGELANVVATLIREIAYDLFSWTDGDYAVSVGESPPSGAMLVDFSLDGVLDKGRQVYDKWRKLSGKVPKLEVVLHRAGHGSPPEGVEVSPEEWQILAAVDDLRNVYEICGELSPNRLQILSRMARLLEKNLLEAVDFKERARPGGLSSKGLKFSTVSTVFRNLFSVLLERYTATRDGDPTRRLAEASRTVGLKGHATPPGLSFDSATVFSPTEVLAAFCFVGQTGDLKSTLRGFSLILQQSLLELKDKAFAEFELAVADMRGVLGVAEELLPDFHLSLHTAVEKALLGEPLPSAPQPTPHRIEPAYSPGVLETAELPVVRGRGQETEELVVSPAAKRAEPASTGVPLGTLGPDAVTTEVDPALVAPILRGGPPATIRPEPPDRTEPVTVIMPGAAIPALAPATAASSPAATRPTAQPAPSITPPAAARTTPSRSAPVEPARPPVVEPRVETPRSTGRRAVAPPETTEAPEPEPASPSIRLKRPTRVEEEETEEDEPGRRLLIGILFGLVLLLTGVIGVVAYLITTNPNFKRRIGKLLQRFHLVEVRKLEQARNTRVNSGGQSTSEQHS